MVVIAIAETAQLEVLLQLKDQLSGGLAKAEAQLKGLNTTATGATSQLGRTSTAFAGVSRNAVTFGGALSHAKGAIGGLLSGPLGLIGLGAGLFSLGKFLTDAISQTQDFGFATLRLTQLTGQNAESASALLAVAQKYGIEYSRLTQIAGFTEKTLGKLSEAQAKAGKTAQSAALQTLEAEKLRRQAAGESVKVVNKLISEQKALDALAAKKAGGLPQETKLVALQKEYGVVLTDTRGKALDFQTVLFHVADAFKAASTAADKAKVASLAATVFGRGYATLVPLLALGSKGLKDAADEAQRLGVTLDATTIKQLAQARAASRNFEEAMQGLKLAIGTQVIPVLTDLQVSLTDFLEHGGIAQIKSTFGSILGVLKEFAGAAFNAFRALKSGWDLIPGPLRDLLVTGLVANKAIKFAFGFSGLDVLKNVFGGGGLFGRGASPANPLWVQSVGEGVGGAGGAAGGLSLLGVGAAVAGGLAIGAAFKILVQDPAFDAATRKIVNDAKAEIVYHPNDIGLLRTSRAAVQTGINDINALPGGATLYAGQLTAFQALLKIYDDAIRKATLKSLGTIMPGTTAQKEAQRNTREGFAGAAPEIKKAIIEGNRQLPQRRDLTSGLLGITLKVREMQNAVTSVERAGFNAAISAIWAVRAAVLGAPFTFGGAGDLGRGTGPEGRPVPGVRGVDDRHSRRGFTVNVVTRTSARIQDSVSSQQTRMGPTAVRAGAVVAVPG